METLASRQSPLYRTAMDKCGALSHTVTYASLLHNNNICLSEFFPFLVILGWLRKENIGLSFVIPVPFMKCNLRRLNGKCVTLS